MFYCVFQQDSGLDGITISGIYKETYTVTSTMPQPSLVQLIPLNL